MGTPTTRAFTPARVVALVIITMLVPGLVSIRFASQPDTVSVPAGAKAGELVLEPYLRDRRRFGTGAFVLTESDGWRRALAFSGA